MRAVTSCPGLGTRVTGTSGRRIPRGLETPAHTAGNRGLRALEIPAMGLFLPPFGDFALILAGGNGFVADGVALARCMGYFPTGKKLPKWGCFCLFCGIFGIPAGWKRVRAVLWTSSTGSGLSAGSEYDGSSRQAGVMFGVLVMPTVVGAVEGKVKRDVEASAAGGGRLIDPVPMRIQSRFVARRHFPICFRKSVNTKD